MTDETRPTPSSHIHPVRKPGELLTPRAAIRSYCMGCVGEQSKEIALCPTTSCPLWPQRFHSRKRELKIVGEEQRLGPVSNRFWAEKLPDYRAQKHYQAEIACEAQETPPGEAGATMTTKQVLTDLETL